jgi:N,N'-diacetyllegionaminate synthase
MQNKKIFIIAEAGVNHNGNITIAKKLIKVAAKVGADAIKFQTFKTESLSTPKALKAKYQISKKNLKESQMEMLKKLELTKKMHLACKNECKKNNIIFISSPFDLDSIDFLKKLKINIIKIPSGQITDLLYLECLGKLNKKIILSSGMSTVSEIKKALEILRNSGTEKKNITLLHCNSEYPSPYKDLNLRAISFLKKKFKINVGYSDHSIGIEVPIAVVALGAKIIEKHITLDKNMKGPDHKASIEPHEFSTMVKKIRNIEAALGLSKKFVTLSERKNLRIVRKSLYAKKKIQKKEKFSLDNLIALRPGIGISPMKIKKIIGKKSKYNFKKNQLIRL